MNNLKNILATLSFFVISISCNSAQINKDFIVKGTIKSAKDQKVYLEEIFFSIKAPVIKDSFMMKGGVFTLKASAKEEGIYRIWFQNEEKYFLLINDESEIVFTGDMDPVLPVAETINTPVNKSLIAFVKNAIEKSAHAQSNLSGKIKTGATVDAFAALNYLQSVRGLRLTTEN